MSSLGPYDSFTGPERDLYNLGMTLYLQSSYARSLRYYLQNRNLEGLFQEIRLFFWANPELFSHVEEKVIKEYEREREENYPN